MSAWRTTSSVVTRARAGGEHVDGQRDVVGGPRPGDRDVVAGRDRGAGERRAELAGADDAEAQIVDSRRGASANVDRCDAIVSS